MADKKLPITGDNILLYRVPKSEIIDFLLKADQELLKVAFVEISGMADEVSKTSLADLDYSDVIRVFQVCTATSEADAVNLYEEYRYRGMKALYMYECDNLDPAKVYIPKLNKEIAKVQAEYKANQTDCGFFDLKAKDSEAISIPGNTFIELSYTYIASVIYTDSRTEYPARVNDLRRGFIWIHEDQGWLAVCARDEGINNVLITALENHLQCIVKRLPLSKPLIQRLEPDANIRRATCADLKTGTNRRWTNAKMADDTQAMQEFQERDKFDDRPVSSYNETLPDGTAFALGYCNQQGKMFCSRDLTVTQMREWGPVKIGQIVELAREFKVERPQDIIGVASSNVLKIVPAQSKKAIAEITLAIAACKKQNFAETYLETDSLTYKNLLGNRVNTLLRVSCKACEGPTDLRCPHCQSYSVKLQGDHLVCGDCGKDISLSELECSEGHKNPVSSLSEIIYLAPTSLLLRDVSELIEHATDQRFKKDEEFFCIQGNRLFLSSAANQVIYELSEIPELAKLVGKKVSEDNKKEIKAALSGFKEKCNKQSIEKCAECVDKPRMKKCYLRLFGLLDASFKPKPHQGHEYGDYSKLITVDDKQEQLVIAMKKSNSDDKEITLRDTQGKDIYSQVARYRVDSTVNVIAVCVPRRLEAGFKALLRDDAKHTNKKLVFIDGDNLVRLVNGVMLAKKMSLEDI